MAAAVAAEEDVESDEYETDSQASSGSGDGSLSLEEEQWSLTVRLLSAVDLPPSLSPAVPLCPWFKFGLVEDVNAALDRVEEEDKKKAAEREERRKQREEEEAAAAEREDGGERLAQRDVDTQPDVSRTKCICRGHSN